MTIDPRLQQLLDALLDSHATPEEVCRSCPDLLPEVRARWRAVCHVRAELDALFPAPTPRPEGMGLPQVPGHQAEALLGHGGMGVVYLAWHLRLHRRVALKMLLAGAHAQPAERVRLLREAEAVAALSHPNIVQVYEVGDVDGWPFFTMEFAEGGSLAQKLAGAPQPADRAAELVATIAGAIQVAHQGGIVHRDLKPANILLTADGTPKVTDFGLARRLDEGGGLTLSGAPVGTPSYMAPEQARGDKGAIGPATDVYALGAVLYELLTGRPPFRAETAAATLQQVISENPVSPSRLNASVPRDLGTICLKCLHKEPRLRYASAAALAEDLLHFLRGEAITARPERWPGRLLRRVRRRPAFSAGVAVAALAVTGLTGGGLWLLADRAAAAREQEAERTTTERAAEDDLREMVAKLSASSWPEARAAAERARGRLGGRESRELRRLLDQGDSELKLAARLEDIRLALARRVQQSRSERPDEYEAAFREAGLGQIGDDPEAVAGRVRASNIPDALVAALDHWSGATQDPRQKTWVLSVAQRADPDPAGWRDRARDSDVRENRAALVKVIQTAPVVDQPVTLMLALDDDLKRLAHAKHDFTLASRERLPFLKKVQQAHPGDFWANLALADAMVMEHQLGEGVRYCQAAVATRPQTAFGHHKLAVTLVGAGRKEEAVEQFRRALALDPTADLSRLELVGHLFASGRQDEAIENLRTAIGIYPNNSGLHIRLGDFLERMGRYAEAVPPFREAVALDPRDQHAPYRLRALLVRLGREEEARADWQKSLEADPPEHAAWYGYAEFCLFLGQEDEYRRARRDLLSKFGATTDPYVAERTARACLLRPAAEGELRQAVALAERAAAVEPSKYQGAYAHFLFARGLADYRQGRLDRAIALMRGEASRVLGPAPRLVLALALHRSGQAAEARKVLAAAVLGLDWRAGLAGDQDGWISHVLRREAEGLILPNLPDFLEGKYEPRDNDERLALLGVCQFTDRSPALARLYADAFAADPKLAQDVPAGTRYSAARAAARAGCGQGQGADRLPDEERARWRRHALDWLRQDLAWWRRALDGGNAQAKLQARKVMQHWQADDDLAGLREPRALEALSPDERKECLALWQEVAAVLSRA